MSIEVPLPVAKEQKYPLRFVDLFLGLLDLHEEDVLVLGGKDAFGGFLTLSQESSRFLCHQMTHEDKKSHWNQKNVH